jgi:phosphatidate cytidylyltransferase
MNLLHDRAFQVLASGTLAFLIVATVAGRLVQWRAKSGLAQETARNLNARINAWWVMSAVFAFAVLTGGAGSLIMFGLLSFLALREFITLTPTSVADHEALVYSFFVVTPLQYFLVWSYWADLFTIMIPVYGFLFITLRMVLSGDTRNFLARVATVQLGLMICVYLLSYAPALLEINLRNSGHQGAKLLLYLVLVTQFSDVFQYICGKLFGRHRIAPTVSPSKTWEGLIGGVAGAVLLGTGIWWATPFNPWEAAAMALVIALMGFGGGLVMSAVKRDRGVKDWGSLIGGHGGVLDRVDSLTFAAPIFFHATRFFFGA